MRKGRGFTLIELIIVLAIASLFVTVAMPGFSHLLARNRRAVAILSLVRGLHLARSHAIMSRHYVAVCKSDGGDQCAASPAQWDAGWIVFVNLDQDQPPRVDSGESILRRHGPLDDALTVTGNRDGFNFRPRSIRSTAGSLFVCHRGQPYGEAIIVSVTGRVRTSPEHDGQKVQC